MYFLLQTGKHYIAYRNIIILKLASSLHYTNILGQRDGCTDITVMISHKHNEASQQPIEKDIYVFCKRLTENYFQIHYS